MSDVFREVDEEVRQERLKQLWKAYGGYVVALAAAVVLGVAVNVGWREYRQARMDTAGEAYLAAARTLAQGEASAAAQAFASLAEEADAGYATLARLRQAQALYAAGAIDEAVRVLDALAADEDVEDDFRDLATLAAAYLEADRAPAEAVEAQLAPLTAEGSRWRLLALELSGAVAAKAGANERARAAFEAIAEDATASPAQRQRAEALRATLGG